MALLFLLALTQQILRLITSLRIQGLHWLKPWPLQPLKLFEVEVKISVILMKTQVSWMESNTLKLLWILMKEFKSKSPNCPKSMISCNFNDFTRKENSKSYILILHFFTWVKSGPNVLSWHGLIKWMIVFKWLTCKIKVNFGRIKGDIIVKYPSLKYGI